MSLKFERYKAGVKFYRELEQNTPEWHEARRGIVTASEVHKLLTSKGLVATNQTSRAYIAQLAAERITGRVENTYQSFDMMRGSIEEPYAREAYKEHYGDVFEIGFMTRDFDGVKLGASPDGLTRGDAGGIEIKSRKPHVQVNAILTGQVPQSNMPQLQTIMLVGCLKWIDYVSFSNGMHLWVKRVYPDHHWQKNIIEAVKYAEGEINGIVSAYEHGTANLPLMEYIDHDEEPELIL